jgi:hypothetical protein
MVFISGMYCAGDAGDAARISTRDVSDLEVGTGADAVEELVAVVVGVGVGERASVRRWV